ncbi:TonB-dependent receptor [Brevundimonas sp.]|jgi:iron complex outermembrane receptor protein|uniref:TonB-dependent receptor plug domain-containing protein n=1 Tax=Brevundimonas sp. TaxID=1871086 RepID=UPI0028AC6434|nr:TonB-dependent receptor [Brevundimonas sp.]
MKTALLAAAGLSAIAHAANAQSNDATQVDEIVVTGTRSAGRSALAASTPIDVVSAEAMEATGYTDLNRALNQLQPSVNFARAATTATAANTRPITLRGLAPDQVLVLVNGKRRHANSVLNVNNSIGRGSAGVDLDAIPESAIARIEILRDGAAAQYGSDAIAGVVNIILKSNAGGGAAFASAGVTGEGDGETWATGGHVGFAIGDGGHLTLSAEARGQAATNRAHVDQRFGRVTYRIGDPKSSAQSAAFDAALPLGGVEIYGFGTLTHKVSNNAAGFRVPGFSAAWPNGFLPIIEPTIWDGALTAGLRGAWAGFDLDLSQTYGRNGADFDVHDTANASLGATSPTRFDSGGVKYEQWVTDATASRPLTLMAGGNLAVGGQLRHETYAIRNGEPDAYFGLGADGFAGFNPRNPTDARRDAQAAFVDMELRPVASVFLGLAARYDHYDGFGGDTTYRATARWDVTESLAVRASAGTGFKAPSLQQQYFSAVQGATSAGQLVTVGTLPVSDPVAKALGAEDLKPERSRNLSAGVVVGPWRGFSATADYFDIRIDDRIALSEQLSGAAVVAVLRAAGITNFQQARFFTNAVDTTTKGFEIMARWRGDLDDRTALSLNLGYGRFDSTLDRLRANPVLPTLPLLNTKSILFLTEAQPKDKITGQAVLSRGPLSVQLSTAVFGDYVSAPLVAPQTFDGRYTVDVSAAYEVRPGLTLEGGVQNLSDVRPQELEWPAASLAATGGSFPTGEETPLGVNGRSFFIRASARF